MPSGSAREFSLDGISFQPVSDASINISNTQYKSEFLYTFNNSFEKIGRVGCYISGVKLKVTPAEYDVLCTMQSTISDDQLKAYVVLADGTSFQGLGKISELGEYETQDGVCTLKFECFGKFEVFAA